MSRTLLLIFLLSFWFHLSGQRSFTLGVEGDYGKGILYVKHMVPTNDVFIKQPIPYKGIRPE